MRDFDEINPHLGLLATESYVSEGERAWLRWVDKVEKILGHSLDGDQRCDGYSLDYAYDAFAAGVSVPDYVVEVREAKCMRAQYRTFRDKYRLPALEAWQLARKQLTEFPKLALGVVPIVREALGIGRHA